MDESYPPIKRAAWRQLSDSEYQDVWDRFYLKFDWHKSADGTTYVITDPVPSVTFDLSEIPEGADWATAVDAIEAEAMRCLVMALPEVETLLVLDYSHPAFELRPRVEALDPQSKDFVNGYPGVYPNGDYYIYLTPDFSEGSFGHPWEPSLCVFGPRMIGSLARSLSTWLPIKRIDGTDAMGLAF